MSSTDSLPDFVTNPDRKPVNKASGTKAASTKIQTILTLPDNATAQALFGQYDQNLAVLERDLHLRVTSRGNEVVIDGDETAVRQAETVLDALQTRIEEGEEILPADVEGAVRQVGQKNACVDVPEKTGMPAQDKLAAPKPKFAAASISTARKTIHARTPTQDAYIRAMAKSEMVFGTGPAGTGKTYLAVAYAASLLERGAVDRIILSRPAVEAGERLGFLPGDMKEKVDPYLRPLYDALYDMMPGDKVERAITSGIIEIAPLAFMRGRTLAHAVVILDEAQNTTTMQMKMFLTRLGEGSKMIITGDPSQIDLPPGHTSGLVQALDVLSRVEGIDTVAFGAGDVVRHKLVGRIVDAYDKAAKTVGDSQNHGRPQRRP
ncbi:MAG: PhoH family protein [Pseudomonadota bacterium]